MLWKSISGYKGRYEVSDEGHIATLGFRSDGRKFPVKPLRTRISNCGYETAGLTIGKTLKRFYVHRLVAEAFIPNPKKLKCINHKNGNRSDNRVSNLEWCTHSENNKDGYKRGRVVWNKGRKGRQKNHNTLGLKRGA